MCRPSRYEVQQLLCSKLAKVDIASLALQHGVTIIKGGHVNKGWVGQTLDKVADTVGISAREPDGPDYELKSVHVIQRGGEWLAKETVAITMLSPERLLNESFETSAYSAQIN